MSPETSKANDGLLLAIPTFCPIISFLATEASPIAVIDPPFEKLVKEFAFSATILDPGPTLKTFEL